MKQVAINRNVIPPMPVVLAGTIVDGKANFMTVGWCSRVNAAPPLIAIGINKKHQTPTGILANEAFSICFPGSEMEQITDYCGVVSGKKVDKSTLFDTFTGELENAPMIEDCPVNLECKLVQTVELPTNYLFIGEIVNAYARADVLENGRPQVEKTKPMILTMPDNRYWQLETSIGRAWKDGLGMKD